MKLPHFSRPSFTEDADASQERFEYALKQYLGTPLPHLRRDAADKLAATLEHPRQILETGLLTDDHSLKKEALIISDAFETVTNGMYNPEVLEGLEEIAEGSLFYHWKELILAIFFYYQGLPESSRIHAGRIPDSSVPGRLKKFLSALESHETAGLGREEFQVFREIHQLDPRMSAAIEQVLDALDTGLEEMFLQGLEKVLTSLPEDSDDLGRSLALWSLNQLAVQDFDPDNLGQLIQRIYGKPEGCRLIALGLLPFDPENAALFWLQFLIFALREGALSIQALRQAWSLLREMAASLGAAPGAPEPDQEFKRDLESLLSQLRQTAERSMIDFTPLEKTWEELKRSWDGQKSERAAKPPIKAKNTQKPVQFELFAS